MPTVLRLQTFVHSIKDVGVLDLIVENPDGTHESLRLQFDLSTPHGLMQTSQAAEQFADMTFTAMRYQETRASMELERELEPLATDSAAERRRKQAALKEHKDKRSRNLRYA